MENTKINKLEEKGRSLRDDELVAVCRFLGVNPMDFADEAEKKGE